MPSTTLEPSAPSDLLGRQRPRIRVVPHYVSTAGDEAVQVYELTGNRLDEGQKLVLRDAMGEREDGHWASFEVADVESRQNGKDETLCARELWGLFAGGEGLLIHSAHKFDTAMEHMDRLFGLIDEVPEFRKRLAPRQPNRSHGSEGIRLRSGARIRFRARTKSGGGRGYAKANCVVFNEAMELPEEIPGSLLPILSASSMQPPGPQVWLAASAADQTTMSNAIVLARVRAKALSGMGNRLAYLEWSAGIQAWLEARGLRFDPALPEVDQITPEFLADPDMWAQANRALGVRISVEHVQTELESPSMGPRQFAIERLGVGDWPDTSEDAGRIISREEWGAVKELNPENRIVGAKIFAADANPGLTWASIGVSGKRADGQYNGSVVDHHPGTDWIVGRCKELKAEHPGMRVVIHKQGPLGSHLDDLKKAKIRVIEANTEDYSRACTGFVAGVLERRFRYPFPQPRLDDALRAARKKETAESTKWTRADAESPDISPLVAVTLAYWGAERAKRTSVVDMDDIWQKIAEEDG